MNIKVNDLTPLSYPIEVKSLEDAFERFEFEVAPGASLHATRARKSNPKYIKIYDESGDLITEGNTHEVINFMKKACDEAEALAQDEGDDLSAENDRLIKEINFKLKQINEVIDGFIDTMKGIK